MNKKIIFLDGDGTLWYPKKTKRTEKAHWIYTHPETKDNYLEHLEMTPRTKETLEYLLAKGIHLVVISANPRDEEVAVLEIKERLGHFELNDLFHKVRSSKGDDPKDKSRVMLEVLQEMNVSKEDALMVGDSFKYDYLAAHDAGIPALWIENSVSSVTEIPNHTVQSIKEVHELMDIIK